MVTGAGRAFCAGMDLSAEGNVFGLDESLRPTPEELRDRPTTSRRTTTGVRDTGGQVTLAIHALPKPVIAAINGPAVGIGATMTLAMDIRLASTKARIGFVFGRLGIVPEAASSLVPAADRRASSRRWSGSTPPTSSPPRQALAGRLVRSVHEPDDLLPAAHDLARSFVVDRSPVALGLAKQMLYRNSAAGRPARGAPVRLAGDVLAPRSATARRASRRSWRSGPRVVHRAGLRAAPDLLVRPAASPSSRASSTVKCRSAPASWYVEVSAIEYPCGRAG